MAKQLGNMYTKFDIHAMFTSGENKYFLNCLHLGSYAAKHYSQNEVFAAKWWSESQILSQNEAYRWTVAIGMWVPSIQDKFTDQNKYISCK